MNKMGWTKGKTLGKDEDNPTGLLAPLKGTRTGIEQNNDKI